MRGGLCAAVCLLLASVGCAEEVPGDGYILSNDDEVALCVGEVEVPDPPGSLEVIEEDSLERLPTGDVLKEAPHR